MKEFKDNLLNFSNAEVAVDIKQNALLTKFQIIIITFLLCFVTLMNGSSDCPEILILLNYTVSGTELDITIPFIYLGPKLIEC